MSTTADVDHQRNTHGLGFANAEIAVQSFSGRRAWFDGERLDGDQEIVARSYQAIIRSEIVPVKGEPWVAGMSQAGIVAALHSWDPGGVVMVKGPSTGHADVELDFSSAAWASTPD